MKRGAWAKSLAIRFIGSVSENIARLTSWATLSAIRECGDSVTLRSGVVIKSPEGLNLGSRVLINHNSLLNAKGGIAIGSDVVIGFGTIISTSEHNGPTYFSNSRHRPIVIGSNVWIGAGVIVNPGSSIGSNVIIGSGAVVNGDIPDGVIAVGVPAKPVRTSDQLSQ